MDFPAGSDSKASACDAGDLGLIPGLGRSPGEGNGNPLQYSYLENPMGSQRAGHDRVANTHFQGCPLAVVHRLLPALAVASPMWSTGRRARARQ